MEDDEAKDDFNDEVEYRIMKIGTTWIIMSNERLLNEGQLE